MLKVNTFIKHIDWFWVCVFFLVIISTGLRVYEMSLLGIGLSHDSANFFAAAASIGEFGSFTSYDNEPFAFWPPLYPATLFLVSRILGIELITAAEIVNIFLYVIILIQVAYIFKYVCISRMVSLFGFCIVLFSYPLIHISIFAWSELLYVTFSLFVLILLGRVEKAENIKPILLLGVFCGLAILTRHVGVVLVLTVTVLLFRQSGRDIKIRLREIFIFWVLSGAVWLGWLARTFALTGTPAGTRGTSNLGVWDNFTITLDVLSGWLLPTWVVPAPVRIIIILLLAGIISYAFILGLRKTGKEGNITLSNIGPHGLYVLFYLMLMIVIASTSAIDTLHDPRLFAPITVSFWVIVVVSIEYLIRFYMPFGFGSLSYKTAALGSVVLLWLLAHPVRFNLYMLNKHVSEGVGVYTTVEWQNNKVISCAINNRTALAETGLPVYSNFPDALYVLSGINSMRSPRKYLYHSANTVPDDLVKLDNELEQTGKLLLIWFNDNYRPYLYNLEKLSEKYRLDIWKECGDGAVYLINAR